MEPTEEHQKQIEEIMQRMECPQDFEYYPSDFENTCKTKTVVPGELIECLDKSRKSCVFGSSFGSSIFRQCPLRDYIAKTFHL